MGAHLMLNLLFAAAFLLFGLASSRQQQCAFAPEGLPALITCPTPATGPQHVITSIDTALFAAFPAALPNATSPCAALPLRPTSECPTVVRAQAALLCLHRPSCALSCSCNGDRAPPCSCRLHGADAATVAGAVAVPAWPCNGVPKHLGLVAQCGPPISSSGFSTDPKAPAEAVARGVETVDVVDVVEATAADDGTTSGTAGAADEGDEADAGGAGGAAGGVAGVAGVAGANGRVAGALGAPTGATTGGAATLAGPTMLLLEFMASPVRGLDNLKPHFTWRGVASPQAAASSQVAYRVNITTRGRRGGREGETTLLVWSSGRVDSSTPMLAVAAPLPLASDSLYAWTVETWNTAEGTVVETAGNTAGRGSTVSEATVSEAAVFSTGLLSQSDWGDAQWISAGACPEVPEWTQGAHWLPRASCEGGLLRKEFTVDAGLWAGGKVSRVSVFVSGCHYYELTLDGERVGGDAGITNTWTRFNRYVS